MSRQGVSVCSRRLAKRLYAWARSRECHVPSIWSNLVAKSESCVSKHGSDCWKQKTENEGERRRHALVKERIGACPINRIAPPADLSP